MEEWSVPLPYIKKVVVSIPSGDWSYVWLWLVWWMAVCLCLWPRITVEWVKTKLWNNVEKYFHTFRARGSKNVSEKLEHIRTESLENKIRLFQIRLDKKKLKNSIEIYLFPSLIISDIAPFFHWPICSSHPCGWLRKTSSFGTTFETFRTRSIPYIWSMVSAAAAVISCPFCPLSVSCVCLLTSSLLFLFVYLPLLSFSINTVCFKILNPNFTHPLLPVLPSHQHLGLCVTFPPRFTPLLSYSFVTFASSTYRI